METLTQQDRITEGNELIAEFMGLSAIRHKYNPNVYEWLDLISGKSIITTPDQMKFNQSWDWLMPVVEKIHRMEEYSDEYQSECIMVAPIMEAIAIYGIEGAFERVVEFIQWYNQRNPKAMNVITVYAEMHCHTEVWAVFTDEEIYMACLPALEKLAEENRMIITESIETE